MNAKALMKEYQSKRIVNFIREYGPVSRVELSEKLQVSQPTLTRIANDLVKNEVLYEGELGKSSGGRRPILLHFNENCYYSFGVDLGRDHVQIALLTLHGNIISIRNKDFPPDSKLDGVLDFLQMSIRGILDEVQISEEKVLGIGVGLPGPLNEDENGLISPPNFYNESQIPLKQFIQNRTGYQVILENDASVASLAERWHSADNSNTNFVYVLADVGIGSGIISEGQLYRGYRGDAGEIGHSIVDIFGQPCTCGSYGCLETVVSIPKVKENFVRKAKLSGVQFNSPVEEMSFSAIVKESEGGNAVATEVLQEAGRYLGVGIANIINLVAPQKIILGGRLGTSSKTLVNTVKETIKARTVSQNGANVLVETSNLEHSIVIGAGALISDEYFSLSF